MKRDCCSRTPSPLTVHRRARVFTAWIMFTPSLTVKQSSKRTFAWACSAMTKSAGGVALVDCGRDPLSDLANGKHASPSQRGEGPSFQTSEP